MSQQAKVVVKPSPFIQTMTAGGRKHSENLTRFLYAPPLLQSPKIQVGKVEQVRRQ